MVYRQRIAFFLIGDRVEVQIHIHCVRIATHIPGRVGILSAVRLRLAPELSGECETLTLAHGVVEIVNRLCDVCGRVVNMPSRFIAKFFESDRLLTDV